MAKKNQTHYSGIGGQAVLEGVMMKNRDKYAVAVKEICKTAFYPRRICIY